MIKLVQNKIDPSDDDFGAVLNCAVRYCLGRQTYMPGIIISFISPYIEKLSNRTLWTIQRDIDEAAAYPKGLGDPEIDKPMWLKFRSAVTKEIERRKGDT